jgi:chitin disaccharide deacetylase
VSRLIVNADDFGLTGGVNRAILELHRSGLLTSATLMARAAATEEAIEIAKSTPSLGVGCHVVLVDGEPILSGIHDIPNVADPAYGRFEPTLLQFLLTIYPWEQNPWPWFGASTAEKVDYQIEIEARAQIQSLQQRGVTLTHIDTHKHTHMFPRVLRPVLRAARSCGIRAVRNPFEPAWSVRATPNAPFTRRAQVKLLRLLAARFHRIVAEEGFTTTAGALGVLATGTLDAPTVRSLVAAIPADASQTFELVTHPGYNDTDLARANTRLLASRETEREALAALRDAPDLELVSFAELTSFADPISFAKRACN